MRTLLLACLAVSSVCGAPNSPKPNIILIIADDLGWNDVGFHGSNQIPTPNIDALAYSGLILNQHYATPICTPSRSALMTGKYPIHTGMQHGVLYGMEPRGLPLNEKILPQHLKDLGYKTHLVGKWHLGSFKKEYLPLNRGFDSHIGFWTGRIDMYDHTSMEGKTWGFDFRRGFEVAHDLFGEYVTDVFTKEAIKVVRSHNTSQPLFLMVGHSAMHSGNPNEPIRAPDSIVANFSYITNIQRQKYAAVLTKLDESVGAIIKELQTSGLLENSIVLFSTDNGGPAAGFNDNAASNYPLRGVKNTLWEGGIRAASVLWSPLLNKKARVARQKLHFVDWLPTLYGAAGGKVSDLKDIDGIDQWESLSQDMDSQRTTIVHNIDDVWGLASINVDQWKILTGTTYKGAWDQWYGPDGRESAYDVDLIYKSVAAQVFSKLGLMPAKEQVAQMRESATVKCSTKEPEIECKPLESPCLFNIEEDPCERRNLAEINKDVLQILLSKMDEVNSTAVEPNNLPWDLKGDPKFWGRVVTNFGDYQRPQVTCL